MDRDVEESDRTLEVDCQLVQLLLEQGVEQAATSTSPDPAPPLRRWVAIIRDAVERHDALGARESGQR